MDDKEVRWLSETPLGDARVGSQGTRLVAEWTRIGRLSVERDGSNPHFETGPHVGALQKSKIERGAMRLLLRSLEGKLGLHGSAVKLHNHAVTFVGAARDGKSTLAAAMCSQLRGCLLADDAVALERAADWTVEPTEELHFLDSAAIAALQSEERVGLMLHGKTAIAPAQTSNEVTPLIAIVRLVFDDAVPAPRLERLGLVDAFATLIPQIVRFAIDDAECHRLEVERLSDLVTNVPVYRLTRPRRFDELPPTVALIESLALEKGSTR